MGTAILVVFIAVVAIGGLAALRAGARAHEEAEARRRGALASVVATLRRGGGQGSVQSEGGFGVRTARGVAVAARHVTESDGPGYLQITAQADGAAEARIPTDLLIGKETLGSRIGKVFAGPDVETGHDTFDQTVLLRGSEARLHAILDSKTREAVQEALRHGCSVADGRVQLAVSGNLDDAAFLVEKSRAAIELAQTLSVRCAQPVPILLRENALGDPVPAVRQRCLQMLTEKFAAHAETRVALDAASVDPDPSVRLFVAVHGSSGSAEKVEAFAALVLDLQLEPSARVAAMRQLVETNAGARVVEVAERRLEDRNVEIRKLAIGVVGRARRGATVPTLIAMTQRSTDAEELAALAEAFWRLRDPAAEPVLLGVLKGSGVLDEKVLLATVRALGRIGSVASVPALRAHEGFLSGAVGTAAAEAVAAIQARARHASDGQLAVIEGAASEEAGRVSVAPARGAVSVPEKK